MEIKFKQLYIGQEIFVKGKKHRIYGLTLRQIGNPFMHTIQAMKHFISFEQNIFGELIWQSFDSIEEYISLTPPKEKVNKVFYCYIDHDAMRLEWIADNGSENDRIKRVPEQDKIITVDMIQ